SIFHSSLLFLECDGRGRRKRKVKRGAPPFFGLTPDTPAMSLNDPIDDSKSDTGAGIISGVVGALERLKNLGCLVGVKSVAIVPDKVAQAAFRLRFKTEFDLRLGLLGG